MGGETAELAVVVAQAVGHAVALVVALRCPGAETGGRCHDLGYRRALPRDICPFVVGFALSRISIACRQIAATVPLPCRLVVCFPTLSNIHEVLPQTGRRSARGGRIAAAGIVAVTF